MTLPSTACDKTPVAVGLATSAYSRYVQRIRRRYAGQMPLLPAGEPVRATMQTTLDALLASGLETGAALRVLRQLVLERLVVLDCEAPTRPTAWGSLQESSPHAPPLCGSLPPEGAKSAWGGPARICGPHARSQFQRLSQL